MRRAGRGCSMSVPMGGQIPPPPAAAAVAVGASVILPLLDASKTILYAMGMRCIYVCYEDQEISKPV